MTTDTLTRRATAEHVRAALIRECGAVRRDPSQSFHEFHVETRAGTLGVNVFDCRATRGDWWVACRFIDVPRAIEVCGTDPRLNRYSGKWNFHPGVCDADALADVVRSVRGVR